MRRIDELYTAWPFLGSRRMTAMLRAGGVNVNRLMRIAAFGPKPKTTKPAPGHKIYPYLLRGMTIARANNVWAADITYIPIGREGAIRGKPLRTTISDKTDPCRLDHVNRQFHSPAPDRLWLADFTYIATWTDFVFVAFVIDAYL